MVEINLDQIASFFQNIGPERAAKAIDDLKNKSASFGNAFGQSMKTAAEGINQVGAATEKTGTLVEASQAEMSNFSFLINRVKSAFGNLNQEIRNTNPAIISMVGQVGLLAGALDGLPLGDVFGKLESGASAASNNIEDMHKTINKLFDVDKGEKDVGPLDKLILGYQSLQRIAEPAKQMENNILALAAQSGDLGKVLEQVGGDLDGLSLKSERFSKITAEIGVASGMSTMKVAGYAQELMKIPGALDMTVSPTGESTDSVLLLDAAIKTASGTGQSFKEVFDSMNKVYREFGTTGQKALEYVSQLSSASKALSMPLDIIRSYTDNASRSFKMFGDNTSGVINIMGKLGPALKGSGLGPQAIADLVGGVTSSLAKMDIAQKAFLSGQTGGPGGLRGGYQIDLMMKQGRADEVYNKVEQSLRKQFGGQLVTLEQAAQSQTAASQMTKQVAMLTSGPTAIAGSAEEAYRIIEAFSKGTSPTDAKIQTGQEALKEATKIGNKLQERQYDVLVKTQIFAERQAQLAAISAYNLTRMASGTGGNRQLAEDLISDKERSGQNIRQIVQETTMAKGPIGEDVGDVIVDASGDIFDNLNKTKDLIKDIASNLFSEASDTMQDLNIKMPEFDFMGKESRFKEPNIEEILTGAQSVPERPEQRVIKTVNQQVRAEEEIRQNTPGAAFNRRTPNGMPTQERISIEIEPVCLNCKEKIPDRSKVLELIDGQLNSRDTNTNLATGLR